MARPAKPRFVTGEPCVDFFKPRGIPLRELEKECLSVEELEALKLVDIKGLYQEDAAERMEVSRPTFQRVLRSARGKVARCLVDGKALGIEGGNDEYRFLFAHKGPRRPRTSVRITSSGCRVLPPWHPPLSSALS